MLISPAAAVYVRPAPLTERVPALATPANASSASRQRPESRSARRMADGRVVTSMESPFVRARPGDAGCAHPLPPASGKRVGHIRPVSDHEPAVDLEVLSVDGDAASLSEVADHVPMDGGIVDAAR